jgi:hypothetical protein
LWDVEATTTRAEPAVPVVKPVLQVRLAKVVPEPLVSPRAAQQAAKTRRLARQVLAKAAAQARLKPALAATVRPRRLAQQARLKAARRAPSECPVLRPVQTRLAEE